jgi:hypothetical protein
VTAHNPWHVSIKLGATIPSERAKRFAVENLGVAVASAVVMTLKPQESTGMVRVMGVHRMGWCSISGKMTIHTESVTMTDGVYADAQGQGRDRRMSGENGSEAAVEKTILAGRQGIGIATTTVTGLATDDDDDCSCATQYGCPRRLIAFPLTACFRSLVCPKCLVGMGMPLGLLTFQYLSA